MCPVKESSSPGIEKSCGTETSEDKANLPDTSPSPKDAEVEFLPKNDGSASDTSAIESKQSEEGIEKMLESDSDDSEESEMDEKVLWLTFLLTVDECIKLIPELFHSFPNPVVNNDHKVKHNNLLYAIIFLYITNFLLL